MTRRKAKTILILSVALVCGFFVCAIVQTFVMNSLSARADYVRLQNEEVLKKDEDVQAQIEYKAGDEYIDDYYARQGYGKDGDKVTTVE